MWLNAYGVSTHHVYFGTKKANVSEATSKSPKHQAKTTTMTMCITWQKISSRVLHTTGEWMWNWQQDKLQRRRLVFPNTTHNPYETLDTVCNYAMYAWVPFSNADRGSEWFGYASKLLVNCKPVFTEIWIKIRLNMSPKCIQLSLTLSGCLFR